MSSLGLTGEISVSKQYEWEIANFFSLYPTIEYYYYDSPSSIFGNTPWHLRIYPGGVGSSKPGAVSLYLINESNIPRIVSFAFYIKRPDGTLLVCEKDNSSITTSDGFMNFYEWSDLQRNASDLVPSGFLTILCTLKIHQDEKQTTIKTDTVENVQGNRADGTVGHKIFTEIVLLSKNLKDLYTNEDCWDTVLLVQDKEFKVHKSILIARSPVFASMFRHDTVEKQTGKVTINDCDPDSFRQFLEYLYCGSLEDMSSDSALHLYRTSDKYNVQELKTFCTEYLVQNLTVQNVCDVVTLADQYDETSLLSSAQKFFNKNIKGIFVTSEWEDLFKKNFRLANKLLVEMSNAKD